MAYRTFRPASFVALALAIGVSGCGKLPASAAVTAPAATALGEPVSCIQLSQIDNLHYYGDYTIDFEMKNRTLFRNTLPGRCPELGFEQRIAYSTTINQLCSTDIFHIVHSDGSPGASCGFGKFTPIRLDKG